MAAWEQRPLNDSENYNRSPVVKHTMQAGSFHPDSYQTRSFNRKMKMRDTFTTLF